MFFKRKSHEEEVQKMRDFFYSQGFAPNPNPTNFEAHIFNADNYQLMGLGFGFKQEHLLHKNTELSIWSGVGTGPRYRRKTALLILSCSSGKAAGAMHKKHNPWSKESSDSYGNLFYNTFSNKASFLARDKDKGRFLILESPSDKHRVYAEEENQDFIRGALLEGQLEELLLIADAAPVQMEMQDGFLHVFIWTDAFDERELECFLDAQRYLADQLV